MTSVGESRAPGAGVGEVAVGVLMLVPEPLAGRVAKLRRSLRDPVATSVPTHVTLVPPTLVDEASLPAVVEHLTGAAGEARPFVVRLHGTGSFQPVTDVVFLRVEEGAGECERLQGMLRAGPLGLDLRFPYHPHVTLAHDVPQPELDRARSAMADVDVRFSVDRFVLFVDRDGVWERRGEFVLGGSAATS